MKNKKILIFFIIICIILILCGILFVQNTNETIIEGCLKWTCPSIYTLKFPESCIPLVCNMLDECTQLEFAEQEYRNTLNEYYNYTPSSCVKIKVIGKLIKLSCNNENISCTTIYKIKVNNLIIEK